MINNLANRSPGACTSGPLQGEKGYSHNAGGVNHQPETPLTYTGALEFMIIEPAS